MVVGSAIFSAVELALLWDGTRRKLSEQGWIGVLIDLGHPGCGGRCRVAIGGLLAETRRWFSLHIAVVLVTAVTRGVFLGLDRQAGKPARQRRAPWFASTCTQE